AARPEARAGRAAAGASGGAGGPAVRSGGGPPRSRAAAASAPRSHRDRIVPEGTAPRSRARFGPADAPANAVDDLPRTMERWSERRIDAASAVDELESIRRRLLTLVDRVDDRLNEKRLVEALAEAGSVCREDLKELTTQELIDRVTSSGCDPMETDAPGGSTNSKRDANEALAADAAVDGGSKRRRPLTCPQCFERIAASTSCGTCELCEDAGICDACFSPCSSCRRLTCADCLMCCDGCGTRHHCSDCMANGGGKCVICRRKKAARNPPVRAAPGQRKGGAYGHPSLGHANGLRGYPQFYPPSNAPLPTQFARHAQNQFHMVYPQFHQQQPGANAAAATPLANPPLRQLPNVLPNPANQSKPSLPHSIHRFIISKSGTMGLNIMRKTRTKECVISTVHPDSVALKYGIEVGDEIVLPPAFARGEAPDTYALFLAAARHRPLIFEVKRPFARHGACTHPLQGALSLHRFVINEPGPLGLSLKKKLLSNLQMTSVHSIAPNSLADIHGIRVDDVLCRPYTQGCDKVDSFEWIREVAANGARPFVIEAWRAISDASSRRSFPDTVASENPFMFTFASAVAPPALPANGNGGRAVGKDKEIILLDDDSDDTTTWQCDFCGLDDFQSYEHCASHEKICPHRNDNASEEKKKDSD
ncbi:hypothetical protein ACHAWF_014834, partial [Thalassiosira exigua]